MERYLMIERLLSKALSEAVLANEKEIAMKIREKLELHRQGGVK